jgi:hypothetical protein
VLTQKERDVNALTKGLSGLKTLNDKRLDSSKGWVKREITEADQALIETVASSSKNIINQEDIEHFNTIVDCFKFLYGEQSEQLSEVVGDELSDYFKSQLRDLVKIDHNSINTKMTDLLHLKTLFKVYLFSLNKLSVYINDYVDSRVSKLVQFIHKSFSTTFDSIWQIVATNTGKLFADLRLGRFRST